MRGVKVRGAVHFSVKHRAWVYRIIWHKWAMLALIRKFKARFLLVLSPGGGAVY